MQEVHKPEIISFAASQDEITQSVEAGVTHIILDDPAISIRSWKPPVAYDNLARLSKLVLWTKENFEGVKISVNCDGLYHSNEDLLLSDLDTLVTTVPVDYLRVQDIGVLNYMHKRCACILDTQMGNCNWVSVNAFKEFAQRQVVSMDVSYTDICEINKQVGTSLECYVHSRVLLQYSKRRFMQGYYDSDTQKNPKLTQIYKLAQDEDYPGRRFTFLDNHHGHFMYAYFDRCLITCLDQLKQCNFTGWIIDNRGCDWHYHIACITTYKSLLETNNSNLDLRKLLSSLSELAPRPLKPGFFKINQTDKRRYKKLPMYAKQEETLVAKVVDVHKKSRITLELLADIKVGDILYARHPKIQNCTIELARLWDINNNEITLAKAGSLIQIPWQKYIQQQAIVVR